MVVVLSGNPWMLRRDNTVVGLTRNWLETLLVVLFAVGFAFVLGLETDDDTLPPPLRYGFTTIDIFWFIYGGKECRKRKVINVVLLIGLPLCLSLLPSVRKGIGEEELIKGIN